MLREQLLAAAYGLHSIRHFFIVPSKLYAWESSILSFLQLGQLIFASFKLLSGD